MKQTLFLLFSSILFGCIAPNKTTNDELLTHQKVLIEDEYIGKPGPIIPFKDGIIGIESEKSNPPLFQLMKQNDNYKITFIGNRGQGPNDINSAFNIQYLNTDRIGIYDLGSKAFKEINISSIENVNTNKIINFENHYFRVIKKNHNQYIGLSDEDGLFHLLDATGNKLGVFYEYPFKDADEQSEENAKRAWVYQGKLVTNPQKTKLVYFTSTGEIIHFYNIESDQITLIDKIEKEYPIYEIMTINNSSFSKLDFTQTVEGYISLSASDKYVYALFCGKKMEELREGMALVSSGTQLRVFDWNGKLVRTCQLDVPCEQIAVTIDEKRLWAIALTPEPTPVYFDLK